EHRRRAGSLRPARGVPQLHAQAVARAVAHRGADGAGDGDHARPRRGGRRDPRGRPRHRDRRAARHDDRGRGARRLAAARAPRARRRHPRPGDADLARRQEQRVHAGRRAALRELRRGQRARPVGLLRPRGRRGGHGQRGRHQARRDERPVLAAAPRLHHPAPGRLRLDRGGGPRSELRRPGERRPRERVHAEEHDDHGLEPDAPRGDAQARRRHPGPGQRARM
ncbi:MAG: BRAMP, partial [uncultured Solirubrobacteraceae bacterium]